MARNDENQNRFNNDGLQRFKVVYPKRLRDWNSGDESIRWQRIGNARMTESGIINVMINAVPLEPWDGTLRLDPLEKDENEVA